MSKFIKNLKSLFVVEEAGSSQKAAPKAKATPVQKTTIKKESPLIPTVAMNGKTDEKFMNILLQSLEKANQEGYDYLEFMNAIKSLGKMNMDEATRFKSAYTLAQTMGVTPGKLEKSAHYYINILKQEESKFQNALLKQQENNIGARKEAIKSNQKAIEEKKKHIINLQKEIENHEKQAQKLHGEVDTAKSKVSTANANFVASFQFLVNKIQNDIGKMQEYLK